MNSEGSTPNQSKKYLIVVGVILILTGLFTTTFGTTYTTMYSTTTQTEYSTQTTITACMSATGVPALSCTTSGTLVYLGTIRYSTNSTTSQGVIPFQKVSYALNYVGGFIALAGACLIITIIYRKKNPTNVRGPYRALMNY